MRIKKWILITTLVIILFSLTIRGIWLFTNRSEEERKNYIGRLNFEFSAEIDSMVSFNNYHKLVFFHITKGNAERYVEQRLNQDLKYNSDVTLLLHYPRNVTAIQINAKDKFKVKDSLYVNTSEDQVVVYRGGVKIFQNRVVACLNGRPF